MPTRGQASVEAAVLLPALMLVIALLVEPACMGLTLVAMRSAAAECARVALTQEAPDDDVRSFVLRRLTAVPEVPIFHAGGMDDWEIGWEREGGVVIVWVRGHVRPLPLMRLVSAPFVKADDQGVVLEVEVRERLRPSWVRGDYADWQSIW